MATETVTLAQEFWWQMGTNQRARAIGDSGHAITVVAFSNGETEALAISIFECADGRLVRITEYFEASAWRRHSVTLNDD